LKSFKIIAEAADFFDKKIDDQIKPNE